MREVVLYPNEDDSWAVECPSLPGCFSQGHTKADAIVNIREAIDRYIEDLIRDGLSVPEERFQMSITSVPVVADSADWRQVILYPDEDGVWCIVCVSLPGCFSDGKTKEEAIANIREAIELWIKSAQAHHHPIPIEKFEALAVILEETPAAA